LDIGSVTKGLVSGEVFGQIIGGGPSGVSKFNGYMFITLFRSITML
jgi:hypothetical protein